MLSSVFPRTAHKFSMNRIVKELIVKYDEIKKTNFFVTREIQE